jgi:hypothetical protein
MLNSMLKIFVGPVMGGGGLNPHQPPPPVNTPLGPLVNVGSVLDQYDNTGPIFLQYWPTFPCYNRVGEF